MESTFLKIKMNNFFFSKKVLYMIETTTLKKYYI